MINLTLLMHILIIIMIMVLNGFFIATLATGKMVTIPTYVATPLTVAASVVGLVSKLRV